ncbi:MAG TPA: hypothetical protein DCP85_14355, partial [Elusimicrobia bacterium]|nr:hypothetical protein [Elusimicrobiota bacterium]
MSGSNIIIENNYIHDNPYHFGMQIITDHTNEISAFNYNNIMRNNILANNLQGLYSRNNVNLQIYNNLIYGNGEYAGIFLGDGDITSSNFDSNSKVSNNIIIGQPYSVANYSHKNVEYRNNIFFSPTSAPFRLTGAGLTGQTMDYNCYYGKSYSGEGSHGMVADPKFVNAGTRDYHLRSDSPAINKGVALSYVDKDIEGKPRPQGSGYDIGAYEYGSAAPADTQAPTVSAFTIPAAATSLTVPVTSLTATDNVAVTGYLLTESASAPAASATGWSAGKPASFTFASAGSKTLYAWAKDAAGNVSASRSASVTITINASCVTSGATWQSAAFASQSAYFTAEFDAVPNANNINGVTGLSLGAPSAYSSLAATVRFSTSGVIDARKAGGYAAAANVAYTAGTSYHFRLQGNVAARLYSIYVKPAGSAEILLGKDYAFRTEQSAVTALDRWSLYADVGNHEVCNFTIKADDLQAPSAPAGLAFSNATQTGLTLGWTAATDNIGVADYRLDLSQNSGFTSLVTGYSNRSLGNVTSAALTGLSAGTVYYARLRAADAAGNISANSAAASTTTSAPPDVTPPAAPSNVTLSNPTVSSLNLAWTASTDNIGVTSYKLDVSLNSSFSNFIAGYNNKDLGNVTSTSISGLSAGTVYYARLRAYDAAGNVSANSASASAATSTLADTSAPSAPGSAALSNPTVS